MKTLPLITSFALVSALTACTTIRSVETTPAPTAPVTPITNSQTTNSGANPAPATGTGMPIAPVTNPDSGTGVSEPGKMPVAPAPVEPSATPGASMPVPPNTPAAVPVKPTSTQVVAPAPIAAPVTPTPAPVAPVVAPVSSETFSKTVSYSSPAGKEEINFAVTTENGIVTALSVTPKTDHPVSNNYQKVFATNAPAQVVGKSLKGLKVSTVSGASLTTWSFNEFVAGF